MMVKALSVSVVLVFLSACGSAETGPGGNGPAGSPSSPPATSNAPSASSSPSMAPDPTPTSPDARPTELTGVVSDGVEGGCLILTPDSPGGQGVWNLLGNTAGLRAGDRVTVRGTAPKDVMTTCMQGQPFQVSEVVGKG